MGHVYTFELVLADVDEARGAHHVGGKVVDHLGWVCVFRNCELDVLFYEFLVPLSKMGKSFFISSSRGKSMLRCARSLSLRFRGTTATQ